METRVDKVAEKHKSGYNCAQAVACAYCDLVGIDEETMFRMTEGLSLIHIQMCIRDRFWGEMNITILHQEEGLHLAVENR